MSKKINNENHNPLDSVNAGLGDATIVGNECKLPTEELPEDFSGNPDEEIPSEPPTEED